MRIHTYYVPVMITKNVLGENETYMWTRKQKLANENNNAGGAKKKSVETDSESPKKNRSGGDAPSGKGRTTAKMSTHP